MSRRFAPGDRVEYRLRQPDEPAGPVAYEVRYVSIGRSYVAYGLALRGTKEVVKMARHEQLVPAPPTGYSPTGEEPESCCDG